MIEHCRGAFSAGLQLATPVSQASVNLLAAVDAITLYLLFAFIRKGSLEKWVCHNIFQHLLRVAEIEEMC